MISIRWLYIVLVLLLFHPWQMVVAEDDLVTAGQKISEKMCAKCHAVGKIGESPFKAAPPFRTFATKWPIESLQEALAEGIVVGHPEMPEFQFNAYEVGALIAYLKSLSAP